MAHLGRRLRVEQVAGDAAEERLGLRPLLRARAGHVDHGIHADQLLGQPGALEEVDALGQVQDDDIMAAPAGDLDNVVAEHSGATGDCEPHRTASVRRAVPVRSQTDSLRVPLRTPTTPTTSTASSSRTSQILGSRIQI